MAKLETPSKGSWRKGWARKSTSAADWNSRHPIGTPVRFYLTEGDPASVVSRTRSEAFECPNGTMVFIERQAGYVMVSHLEVLNLAADELEQLEAAAVLQSRKTRIARTLFAEHGALGRIGDKLLKGEVDTEALSSFIGRMQTALLEMEALRSAEVPDGE